METFMLLSDCSPSGTANTGLGIANLAVNIADAVNFFEGNGVIRCSCSSIYDGKLPELGFYIDGTYFKFSS